VDGFFSGGEIRFLWDRYLAGRFCGCGKPIGECDVWSTVLDSSSQSSAGHADAATINRWQHDAVRVKHTARILRQDPSTMQTGALASYADTILDVYRVLEKVTSARVIVDSSKRPSNGAVLRLLPDVDAYFVHLVRDPRAVVYSQSQVKPNPDRVVPAEMPRVPPRKMALQWNALNLAAEAVRRRGDRRRRLLLRYEDFASDPAATVGKIVDLVDEQPASLPVTDEGEVFLHGNHTVSGNPSRFQKGLVQVRRDDRWLQAIPRSDYLSTTAITLPLLLRYGYPIAEAKGKTYAIGRPRLFTIHGRRGG
jgi:sulfotransferase family protein